MNYRYYVFILSLFFTIGIGVFLYLRKEIPYEFDVIKLDNGIAIVGIENWVRHDLPVKISHEGKTVAEGKIDSATHSGLLENFNELGEYTITISRGDILGKILYKSKKINFVIGQKKQTYAILVGASIGYQWNLPKFPQRTGMTEYVMGYRGHFDFDKEEVIRQITNYQVKPDMVIIKECSAYFPRDVYQSKEQLEKWIQLLQKENISPVLATTIPVTNDDNQRSRQRSVEEWNSFVRQFANTNNLRVLDLASATEIGANNHHLKPELAAKDGIHLIDGAYRDVLDPLLVSFLKAHNE